MIDILNLVRTPKEIAMEVAGKEKELRRAQKLTQKELAERSGISYASLRRFESTGQISFESLLSIAFVLGAMEDFRRLFEREEALTMEAIINENHHRS